MSNCHQLNIAIDLMINFYLASYIKCSKLPKKYLMHLAESLQQGLEQNSLDSQHNCGSSFLFLLSSVPCWGVWSVCAGPMGDFLPPCVNPITWKDKSKVRN